MAVGISSYKLEVSLFLSCWFNFLPFIYFSDDFVCSASLISFDVFQSFFAALTRITMSLGPNSGSITDADYHYETLDNLQIAVCSLLLIESLYLIFLHMRVESHFWVLWGIFHVINNS